MITCDEIIEETKTISTNFNEKNILCETKNFYILLTFLLITIALMTAVSIYFCLKKYKAKQKYLLPYHVTNEKLIAAKPLDIRFDKIDALIMELYIYYYLEVKNMIPFTAGFYIL